MCPMEDVICHLACRKENSYILAAKSIIIPTCYIMSFQVVKAELC